METLILYWTVTWPEPDRIPRYTYAPITQRECMKAISRVVHDLPGREMLGSFNPDRRFNPKQQTGQCWLIIFPSEPRALPEFKRVYRP